LSLKIKIFKKFCFFNQINQGLKEYNEYLNLLSTLNRQQKLNVLHYLTDNSVYVKLSDKNRLLSQTIKKAIVNPLVVHQFEKSSAKIKLINGVHVYSLNNVNISFARNFREKNASRDATHLLVEDFFDETFLGEKKRQWLHVQNELKKYLVDEKSVDSGDDRAVNSKVILKRKDIFSFVFLQNEDSLEIYFYVKIHYVTLGKITIFT
jgi:hypothetical protein